MRNLFIALLLACCPLAVLADQAAPPPPAAAPGGNAVYEQLRHAALGGEAVTLSNYTLRRDGAIFKLTGTVTFLEPVEGKVTGAVFSGDGVLGVQPPTAVEQRNLRVYFGPEYTERFHDLVLRFTDGTYEELKKAGSAAAAPASGGYLAAIEGALRDDLKYNLAARILQDLLNPGESDGTFWAFIHGERDGKLLFIVDPHGVPAVGNDDTGHQFPTMSPEEVALLTYSDDPWGVWAAYHRPEEYSSGTASSREQNGTMQIVAQKLDTHFEKNGFLNATAQTTFVALQNGLRVVPFDLYRRLRVEKVTDAAGQPLEFIQEGWKTDTQFWVVLPKPMATGEKMTISTTYGGKEAVFNEGGGNYFPIARDNWYPNTIYSLFGGFANFDMTFHTPKGLEMIATGEEVSSKRVGNEDVSEWKTDSPVVVAGFNFGRFRREQAQMKQPALLVQSYANENPPTWVTEYLHATESQMPSQQDLNTTSRMESEYGNVGTMQTLSLAKKPLAEGQLAVQIYTDYFGPLSFKHLALSQQTACNFGQAWPSLIYIPICSLFDNTVKQRLGLLYGDRGYWLAVTSHETAHQWWGHTVAFSSYRDQWMSEGFAEFSASLFVQRAYGTERFRKFWDDELWLMSQKNRFGTRSLDVGPLTLGQRLANTKAGLDTYRLLIYPKGAYVLHMIRMMMWNAREGDKAFKDMMHDFVQTYRGQVATTEDFKAIVEKHMTPEMDIDKNHKMDWFFNEYVYGTAFPRYRYSYNLRPGANGQQVLHIAITGADVGPDFKMLVPIYLEFANGKVVRLGVAPMVGTSTLETDVPLGIKEAPKAVVLNYFDDVLGTIEPGK